MKISIKKVTLLVVGILMTLSVVVSAASSTATISNSQSSATGNYIYTGDSVPVYGTVKARCTTVIEGASIKGEGMVVIPLWPDWSMGSCQTSGSTYVTCNVVFDRPNNAYYVKLSQAGSIYTNGEGSLSY